MKKHLVFFLLLFCSIAVFSQTCINYTTTNSGLATEYNGRVKATSNGKIWFGSSSTTGGLSVFNYNTWRVYKTSNSNIPFNSQWSIAESDNGYMWFGDYYNGLARYNGATNSWQSYKTSNSLLPSNWVNDVINDGAGGIWIGTQNGLVNMNSLGVMQKYQPANSTISGNSQQWLALDDNGTLWWYAYNYSGGATSLGLGKYANGTFSLLTTANSGLTSNTIRSLACDHDTLWITTDLGDLIKYYNNQWVVFNSTNSTLPGSGYVYSIAIDSHGRKWLGHSSSGLYCMEGTTFTRYTTANGLLRDNIGGRIDIDNFDNVWITYGAMGVTVFNPNNVVLPSKITGNVTLNLVEVDSGAVKCKLFKISNLNHPVSTAIITDSGYVFNNILAGDYIIQVEVMDTSLAALNTYHDHVVLWSNAEIISIQNDSVYEINVELMPDFFNNTGNCSISGTVQYATGSKTQVGVDSVSIFLYDASNTLQEATLTNTNGEYSFTDLAYNEVFKIKADILGFELNSFCDNVSFDSDFSSIDGYNFLIDTASNIINCEGNTGINNFSDLNNWIPLFPNPVSKQDLYLNIQNHSGHPYKDIIVYNSMGQVVDKVSMGGVFKLNISNYYSGIYHVCFVGTNSLAVKRFVVL